VIRLLASIFLCVLAGSLVAEACQFRALPAGVRTRFVILFSSAMIFIALSLVLLAGNWPIERIRARMILFLVCFYLGTTSGAFALSLASKMEPSVAQIIIGGISFQGAALILVSKFLSHYRVSWSEAFGFRNWWQRALRIGAALALGFIPVGLGLQQLCAWTMTRMHVQPVAQEAVQALQQSNSLLSSLGLGIIAIILAPIAEEVIFRGILYPAIRQAGFPRLALWGTSLLFAAIHMNIATFVPLLVLAMLLALLYERTTNLLACISAHSLFNAMNFALFYFESSKA